MKRKFITALLLAAIGVAYATNERSMVDIQTDSLIANTKFIYIDGRPADKQAQEDADSMRRRISMFYYDQFRHFSDPAAPYFLFMSKDASLAMGIGGCVRMRGYYDWDGAMPAPGFAPYLISVPKDPANMKHFGTTPAGTTLFYRVLGRNKALGDYQLYIECNFNGYAARDFLLKKAYAQINDFTIGYASSTFSDPAALPPTVDAQGPNNKVSPTSVLVRYMPTIKDRWVLAVSAETPETSIDVTNGDVRPVSNWLPDFAAFVQYQWTQNQHVRLAGIVRTLSYRDMIAARNYNRVGWAFQLSSVSHPMPELSTYVTINYGRGHESLCGDLLIRGGDLIANPAKPGRMYSPAALGWCVGMQYNFRPNIFASATVSQNLYMPQYKVSDTEYRYGWFACVNVFWNLTPRIQVGAEYDWGFRSNANGTGGAAQRAGLMAQFSF